MAMLEEKMVDGIILTASSHHTDQPMDFSKINVPVITVDRDVKGSKIKGKIIVDNKSGAEEAVRYMLDKGYRRILHLAGPITSEPSRQRYEGIRDAIKAGINFDSVFCGNDLIALGAMKALKEEGYKIPQDIGIVGFDDIYMTTMIEPKLTTVHQPNYQMGYKAAQMLIDFIEENEVEKQVEILKTELIIRESI